MEATMICLDNSEWMRNGDFLPTRLEAQQDAANMVANLKLQAHPESVIGLVSYAGGVKTLLSLSDDITAIFTVLTDVRAGGESDFMGGLQVASLALKHRANKHNKRLRIIIFVGSPIEAPEAALKKLGGKLKKNGVAVDVINFGDPSVNEAKLNTFIGAVNKNDNSNLLNVSRDEMRSLSEVVADSPILEGDGGANPTNFGAFGGMDDDIQRAIALSMADQGGDAGGAADAGTGGAAPGGGGADDDLARAMQMSMGVDPTMQNTLDEEEALRLALQMSVEPNNDHTPTGDTPMPDAGTATTDTPMKDADAGATSTTTTPQNTGPPPAYSALSPEDVGGAMQDTDFLNSILSSLPGVDVNDPSLRQTIENVASSAKKKDDKDKDGEGGDGGSGS